MKIAVAGSRTSRQWRTVDTSWDSLLERLREPVRTGETVREYKAMTKEQQSARKDVGGFVGGALRGRRRKAGEVTERWLVTLDADDAGKDDWEQVTSLLEWRMCAYSTHSSTSDSPRLRWVIPLKSPVSPEAYVPLARKVAELIGIEGMDPTTYQPERLMFWASCPTDGDYIFREQDGPVLAPGEILALYGENDAWRDAALWPTSSKEDTVILREQKRQADPTGKRGIVGAFCRRYDVPSAIDEFLPDVYEACDIPGRYTYTKGSTAAGAVIYGNGAWLYSNHATDPASGQLCNAFDLVRIHKFGDLDEGSTASDGTKLPSYKKMCEFATGLAEIKAQLLEDGIGEAFGDMGTIDAGACADTGADSGAVTDAACAKETTPTGAGSSDANEDDREWQKQLTLDRKTGLCEQTLANACLLLRNLPAFKDKLGYNPMNDTITVEGALPWWGTRKAGAEAESLLAALAGANEAERVHAPAGQSVWEEGDWASFYAYMEGLGFPTKGEHNGLLNNALQIVSMEHTFHPIRSYLASLKWDGKKRVETMFVRWLGAPDTELDREVTRLWMMAGVDRVMRPGCQFDEILITCGPQGIGKSKMLRMLARGFFTSSVTAMNMDRDTAEKLQGVWIVELGELDGMKKSGQTAIKNFITSTTDRYRSAYARTATTHQRQCIFAGTSNEGSFLRDDSGERRYWVMPVTGTGDRGELRGFKDEVDQLWAEAVVLWAQRVRENRGPGQKLEDVDLYLYLRDDALEAEMEDRRGGYKMPEEDRDMVTAYLDQKRPARWYEMSIDDRRDWARGNYLGSEEGVLTVDRITIKELRCELFGERLEDCARKSDTSYRIADIMSSLAGWEKCGGKLRPKGYPGGVSMAWRRVTGTDTRA